MQPGTRHPVSKKTEEVRHPRSSSGVHTGTMVPMLAQPKTKEKKKTKERKKSL